MFPALPWDSAGSVPSVHCRTALLRKEPVLGGTKGKLQSCKGSRGAQVVGGCAGGAGVVPMQSVSLHTAARRDQLQHPLPALAFRVYNFDCFSKSIFIFFLII